MSSHTPKERAHHESGHAVAAHHRGWRVDRVSIIGTGRVAGYTFTSPPGAPEWSEAEIDGAVTQRSTGAASMAAAPTRPPTQAEIEGELLQLLAGPEAQRRYSGAKTLLGAEDYDLAQAKRLLGEGRRPLGDVLADLAAARQRAAEFVRQHWAEIEGVALALECSGTLNGSQFRTLIGAVSGPARAAAQSRPEPAALGTTTGEANASEVRASLLNSPARSAPAPAPRRYRVTYISGDQERVVEIEAKAGERPFYGSQWLEIGDRRWNSAHVLAVEQLGE